MFLTRMVRRHARAAVAVAGALATAVALSGCGLGISTPPAGPPTLSKEPVTLRLYWWGANDRDQRTQKAIKDFEAAYPNITVDAEFTDWAGYWQKLATETAAGQAPDVFQMDEVYLASYADRGALADLGKLPQLDTSAIDPGVLDSGKSGGTLYGMPMTTVAFGLLVNMDVLNQLGITLPDTDTWTWQEFNDWAASITKASGGKVTGTSPIGSVYALELWAHQNGETVFKNGNVSITPDVVSSFFAEDLAVIQNGASESASALAEGTGLPLNESDFTTGKTATTFTTVTMASAYSDAAGGANIAMVKLPTKDANKTKYFYLKPGMYWSVSSGCQHPAEAAELVNYLVNDPQAGLDQGEERGIPVNPNVQKSIASSLNPEEQAQTAYTNSVSSIIGPTPEIVPNGASNVEDLMDRYSQEVEFGRQTPDQAAQGFIKELQESINEAK